MLNLRGILIDEMDTLQADVKARNFIQEVVDESDVDSEGSKRRLLPFGM